MDVDLPSSPGIREARALFPHTAQGRVYLNHAGTSPLSSRVVEAMSAYLRQRSEGALDTFQTDLPMVADLRARIQRMINAESPERIAFTGNTSDAINIVASGIRWKAGDRVLVNDLEFPANVWPYANLRRLGVELDFLKCPDGRVSTDAVAGALTPRTRLVALSAVQFLSGHRADLSAIGAICRSRDVIFAVDGIQAAGAVRLDVQAMRMDACAAGAQKWLMGPHGSGFLYVHEELQSRITQSSLGWLGIADPWDFFNYDQPPAPSARRYEGGSMNMPSLWGMHASVATLEKTGSELVERRVLALSGLLIDSLGAIDGVTIITPPGLHERAGIVTASVGSPAEAKKVFKGLLERDVTIALRHGKLRYAPHFYNTQEEILKAVEATRECLAALRR